MISTQLVNEDQSYCEALDVSYFLVDSDQSLPWWFSDRKIILQKSSMTHSSQTVSKQMIIFK